MKKLYLLFFVIMLFSCNGNKEHISYPQKYHKVKLQEYFNLLYGYAEQSNDEYAGAMVADDNGNIYFTVNEDGQLAIVALDKNGNARWSYAWDDIYYDGVFNCDKDKWMEGGMASSLVQDTAYLYAIANSSDVPANNVFSVVVLKIDKSNGKLVWAKKWNHKPANVPTRASNDLAYALAVDDNNVYVTGTLGDDKVLLLIYDKKDGNLKFQGEFELSNLSKDIGTVAKIAPDGSLYIAGMSGNKTFLAKFFVQGKSYPQLLWVKTISTGYRICVDDMDIDEDGNIYLAFNTEGKSTRFMIAKLDELSDFIWLKIFPAERSNLNATRFVKVYGKYLYVGGRVAMEGLNNKSGDGIVMKLDKETGDVASWYLYYTGNENDNYSMHDIEAVVKTNDGFVVFGQVLGAPNNISNYTGVWLTANTITSQSSKLQISGWDTDVKIEKLENTKNEDVKNKYFLNDIKLMKPYEKKMLNAPDYDVFVLKVKEF